MEVLSLKFAEYTALNRLHPAGNVPVKRCGRNSIAMGALRQTVDVGRRI